MGASKEFRRRVLGVLCAVEIVDIGPTGYDLKVWAGIVVKCPPADALGVLKEEGLIIYDDSRCRYQLTEEGERVQAELRLGGEIVPQAGLPLEEFGLSQRDSDPTEDSEARYEESASDCRALTKFIVGGKVGWEFTGEELAAYMSSRPQAEHDIADPQRMLTRLEEAGMVTRVDDSRWQVTPTGHLLTCIEVFRWCSSELPAS